MKQKLLFTSLMAFLMLISVRGWGQTTVTYDFSDGGAVTGLNEDSPGVTLDANIGFGSFKNSSGTNPGIFSGQLRLYQNATKGGSIKIYASNGVTITQVIVHASVTTGPAAYTVDGGTATDLSASTTYTMSDLSAASVVEFYQKDGNKSNRIYVDNFEVTYTSGGPANPTAFTATASSASQIDLSAIANGAGNDIVVAYNSANTFGDPTGSYTAGNPITGGGTVHFVGAAASLTNHTGLTAGETVYYKAWSVDGTDYSAGVVADATTLLGEPTNHATGFTAATNGSSQIDLTWADNDGAQAASGFLIVGKTGTGTYLAPADGDEPADDTDWRDNNFNVKVAHGVQAYSVTGLDAETAYSFKIYPYTNSGSAIDFKLDGTVPEKSATTTSAPGLGLQISDVATPFLIDFDNTVSGVNNGQFAGTGFTTEPAVGQLNSNAWSITGMSDGNLAFGGSKTSGDFANEASTGRVTSGGVYAFEVSASNYALGIQPGGDDWTPGTLVLKVQNQTSATIITIEIIYTVYIFNDQGRSNNFNFSHSADNSAYTAISTFDLSSEETADVSPSWKAYKRVERITGLTLTDKNYYYLKWTGNDVSGSGSRDEFAIDDIKIVANPNDPYALTGTFEEVVLGSNAEVVIEKDASVTVNGTLTNNAGATGLVIASEATGTGSLIHNNDDVSATIQRYVSGGQIPASDPARFRYHLLSIPLAANIQAGDVFTGTYLWHFVPNKPDIDSWTGISSLTENLDYRKGFLSYVETAENTFSFTGNMNNGSFSTAAETIPVGKFKLIPNPYPSAIDWDLVDKTDIENAVYFYNSETGNYVSYLDGDLPAAQKYIPVGQAVFVKAKNANPTITFDNSVRVHSGQLFYKDANQAYKDVLKIAVSANQSADATFIRFRELADNNYNGFDDASKLRGFAGSPQLYTQSADDKALSINTLATSQETVIVPLAYELEVAAEATLSFEYLETFESTVDIFLEDLLLNKMIDLREQSSYSFEHAVENDPLRFKLHFMGVTNVNELASSAKSFNIWASDKQLYIHANTAVDGDLQIELFDLSGRLLQTVSQPMQTPNRISLADYEGVIMVRVRTDSAIQTQKIFIR